MHCGIVDTVGRIKKIVQEEYLWTPGKELLLEHFEYVHQGKKNTPVKSARTKDRV